MVYFIVAIDKNRGMADDHGIPWQGKLPSDIKDFRERTQHNTVLMGYGTYVEFKKPLSDRKNYVATTKDEPLREGFLPVRDARKFLQEATEDVWVIGGAGLFAATLDLADVLYVTQLDSTFDCTKFFPEYEDMFELSQNSDPLTENDITYRFTVWKKK